MEIIDAPTISNRVLKIDGIHIGTILNSEEIAIDCSCVYKDDKGNDISSSIIRISYKSRDRYTKNDKLYSKFDRAYNYLFPKGNLEKARDHIYDKARNLVKEYLEQYEGVESGTYNNDTIPDPESIEPVVGEKKIIPAIVTTETEGLK